MPAAPLPATRFVLIEPSHAGNVGATARAMKVMGFNDLVLVAPRWPDVLARPEAIERASGADDVLARARIVPTLDEALAGVTHLCATVMTPRDFGPPTRSPREHFEMLLKQELPAPATQGLEAENASNSGAAEAGQGVAFLFGCERFGMANDDVYRCHVALSIPTAPDYGSLNLAAAVQLIAYEWRLALGGFQVGSAGPVPAPGIEPLADAAQVAAMLAHWQQALVAVGFLDPAAPKKLMPRLAQLFNRARLRPEEIHILRGVAKAMLEAGERVKR
ncbi:RNA methyltransferase [Ottowia sp.]|uniref:RNA methyltransferase n=1 Tax=Ottowia sp. TaxID=1898956 RepID=UPI001D635FFD|nr:RNA methyltransferase [Ottowia sp.]MCP5257497.1 RNA methyltransferase [Burkholderiaceae bacterium]MCB2026285.1 RNA methyltransferase [Ottowia sp.]MCB2032871.1 RNA methyltransferase [Ottowia sp.]MCB2038138.1 RNA methyltransferase [Ottowia sp.]HRW71002.1 RNA methyltransferase [Ottowia sp.]